MNDAYYELIVAKKKRIIDTLLKICLILFTLVVTYVGLLSVGPLALFLFIGLIIVLFNFIFPRFNAEFEYTLINHDLEISAIYNKQNRKKRTEFDIQEAEIIAPTGSPRLQGFRPVKTLNFSSGDSNSKLYSILISLDSKLTQVIIEPDERMIRQMKDWMGQKMFLD